MPLRKVGLSKSGLGFLLVLLAMQPLEADSRAAEIKAAFVYNFAKFIEWPAEAFDGDSADLTLCLLDGHHIDARLELIEGRSAQGRNITLQKVRGPGQIGQCHILYLPAGRSSLRDSILKASQTLPILTIGDHRAFIENGGMVGLFIESDHVRFRVNLDSAQASGLKMSARILNLAQEVR